MLSISIDVESWEPIKLTSGFGKTTSRQFGRARDVVADTAHDEEATMKDNLAASLILAVGLGMIIGYMIGRSPSSYGWARSG